jgi:hypothetical protein
MICDTQSRGSSVSIDARLRTGRPGFQFSEGAVMEIFLFAIASRLALRPNHPPVRWVTGAFTRVVKLMTHLHLVPKSRMRGAITPLPICLHGVVLS